MVRSQQSSESFIAYDSAGRVSADTATTIPSGVDDRVKRIGYTYDDLSRVLNVTSYSDTAGTAVVNDLQYVYDGWGNVTRAYQAHDGAVSTGSSPFIEYIYADGGDDTSSGVADYVRLSQVNYPKNNGAHVGSYKPNYETSYDSGEVLNRIKRWETAGALQLVEYRWLGAATLVNQILHPQISGGLVMNNGSKSSDYSAWDRYYRQAKVQWQKTNGSVNFEQRNYTYDRMGNRLTMDNSGSGGGGSNWDETYVYDGLNRLTTFKRGTISSGVISSPKFQQAWSLDSLGNWRGYDQTNNDTGLLPVATYPTFSQTRTNNAVNEITGTSGGSFASTGYDAAGNLTQGPKTGAESTSVYFKYDAWNRQAGLDANNDDDLFDNGDWQYEYDGIGRRISKWQDTANDGDNSAGVGEEFYYNEDYQAVEVRVATTTSGAKAIKSDPRERMLWDLTYVDSPALVEIDSDSNGSRDFRRAGDISGAVV